LLVLRFASCEATLDRRQATFHGSLSCRSSHRKFGPMATLGHLFDPAADNVDQLRAIGREFHGRSWSLGTSSNYSVVVSRDPLELLITASGKDKSALGPTTLSASMQMAV
jgi:hypothetical protein